MDTELKLKKIEKIPGQNVDCAGRSREFKYVLSLLRVKFPPVGSWQREREGWVHSKFPSFQNMEVLFCHSYPWLVLHALPTHPSHLQSSSLLKPNSSSTSSGFNVGFYSLGDSKMYHHFISSNCTVEVLVAFLGYS